MAKTGVSFEEVAYACQSIIKDGQSITARNILALTGGSPNNIMKHWQRWRREQEDIALAAVDEELSPQIKQAILSECARKTAIVKQQLNQKIISTGQQLDEMQECLNKAEAEKEKLLLDLSSAHNTLNEKDKHQAITNQRLLDAESRNKELEKLYRESSLAQERSQTEKIMIEKQKESLEKRLENLEIELKECQTNKHKSDLEVARLTAKN